MKNFLRYRFRISPSKRYRQYLWLSLLLPLAVVLLSAVSLWVKVSLSAIFLGSGWYSFYQLRLQETGIQLLEHIDENHWSISQAGDEPVEFRLLPGSYISDHLMILRFTGKSRRKQKLVLFNDSLVEDDFRKLRLRARSALRTAIQYSADDQGM